MKEDASWIHDFQAANATFYLRTRGDSYSRRLRNLAASFVYEDFANVGREGFMYLDTILHSLVPTHDLNIFCQVDANHSSYNEAFFRDDVSRLCPMSLAEHGPVPNGFKPMDYLSTDQGIKPLNPKHATAADNLRKHGFSFLCGTDLKSVHFGTDSRMHEEYKNVFFRAFPEARHGPGGNMTYDELFFCPGACFIVNGSTLESARSRHSKSLKYLAHTLGSKNKPSSGYALERSWGYTFSEVTEVLLSDAQVSSNDVSELPSYALWGAIYVMGGFILVPTLYCAKRAKARYGY